MPERIDKDEIPTVGFSREQAMECQAVIQADIHLMNCSVEYRRGVSTPQCPRSQMLTKVTFGPLFGRP